MERRIDIHRIQAATAAGARTFVANIRAQTKDKMTGALNFGFKTWREFEESVARARYNDHRKRHGRSAYNPHQGSRQLERAQREGSAAWHAWKNEAAQWKGKRIES